MAVPLIESPSTPAALSYKKISLNVGLWMLCFIPGILFDASFRWFWLFYWCCGIFFGTALYFMPPILERKAIEVYNDLIQKIEPPQEQLAQEYYTDTKTWLNRAFRHLPSKPKIKFLQLLFIGVPYAFFFLLGESAHWLQMTDEETRNLLFLPNHLLYTIPGIIGFIWLFYWLLHLYAMFQHCTSILHHFTFWPHIKNLGEMGEKNRLGEFFAMNLLFWVITIVIFGNFFIGIVLGLSGWIFSNVNPRHNYYQKIDKRYQITIISVLAIIITTAFISMARNLTQNSPTLPIVVQFVTTGLFCIILFRLFFMTSESFNISQVYSLWQRLSQYLHLPPKLTIIIVNTLPVLLFLIIKLIIQPIWGLFTEREFGFDLIGESPNTTTIFILYLIGGLLFIMVGAILTSWRLLAIQSEMREFAALSIVIIKPHKMEEHHFHFWEIFASLLPVLFAMAMGGLFLQILHKFYVNSEITRSGLEFFLPIYGMMFVFGCYQGVLTWQSVNGIHYLWHVLAIKRTEFEGGKRQEKIAFIARFNFIIDRLHQLFIQTFIVNGLGFLGIMLVLEQNWWIALIMALVFGFGIAGLVHLIFKSLFKQ